MIRDADFGRGERSCTRAVGDGAGDVGVERTVGMAPVANSKRDVPWRYKHAQHEQPTRNCPSRHRDSDRGRIAKARRHRFAVRLSSVAKATDSNEAWRRDSTFGRAPPTSGHVVTTKGSIAGRPTALSAVSADGPRVVAQAMQTVAEKQWVVVVIARHACRTTSDARAGPNLGEDWRVFACHSPCVHAFSTSPSNDARQPTRLTRLLAPLLSFAGAAVACHDTTAPVSNTPTPCSASGTLQLSVNQAARVDCSNGGTTLTLTGNGASYLVVPQFAVSLVPNTEVAYSLSSSAAASASIVPDVASVAGNRAASIEFARSSEPQPGAAQRRFDGMLREHARSRIAANVWTPSLSRASRSTRALSTSQVPSVGSLRAFRVIANASGNAFSTVGHASCSPV